MDCCQSDVEDDDDCENDDNGAGRDPGVARRGTEQVEADQPPESSSRPSAKITIPMQQPLTISTNQALAVQVQGSGPSLVLPDPGSDRCYPWAGGMNPATVGEGQPALRAQASAALAMSGILPSPRQLNDFTGHRPPLLSSLAEPPPSPYPPAMHHRTWHQGQQPLQQLQPVGQSTAARPSLPVYPYSAVPQHTADADFPVPVPAHVGVSRGQTRYSGHDSLGCVVETQGGWW
jgi:hypothetical protein